MLAATEKEEVDAIDDIGVPALSEDGKSRFRDATEAREADVAFEDHIGPHGTAKLDRKTKAWHYHIEQMLRLKAAGKAVGWFDKHPDAKYDENPLYTPLAPLLTSRESTVDVPGHEDDRIGLSVTEKMSAKLEEEIILAKKYQGEPTGSKKADREIKARHYEIAQQLKNKAIGKGKQWMAKHEGAAFDENPLFSKEASLITSREGTVGNPRAGIK